MINIVFDTTFLHGQKFDWGNRIFEKMTQLKALGLVQVFIPDIVDREVKRKLVTTVNTVYKNVKMMFDENPAIAASDLETITSAVAGFRGREPRVQLMNSVLRNYEDFKEKIEVVVIGTNESVTDVVFDLYFDTKPPFENKDDKKKEFPDAFAVESVKKYFEEDYYVITNDKGWKLAFSDVQNCTVLSLPQEFYTLVESLFVQEEQKRIRAHELISQNIHFAADKIKSIFEDRGFVATDVQDDYVEGVEVTDVTLVEFSLTDVKDEDITFNAVFCVEYKASVDYDDPDSWYKDDETKEIFYWNRVSGAEIEKEIEVSGEFTYSVDPEVNKVIDLEDYDIDIPDTIYFEIFEDENYK